MTHADDLQTLMGNLETLGAVIATSHRVEQRAKRGADLHQWALQPQRPDPGSPLAIADAKFPEAISTQLMTEVSLFPVMNAVENLATAEFIIAGWKTAQKARTTSIVTLCRAAIESASRTVWVLGDPDPKTRHARCLTLAANEFREQSNYHELLMKSHTSGKVMLPDDSYEDFVQHTDYVEARRKLVRLLGATKLRGYTSLVRESAEWVDNNTPAHDDSELASVDYKSLAQQFYSIGSSVVHGLEWATEYLHAPKQLLNLVADSLASAVNMTECAVALFEAQATNMSCPQVRDCLYPERLTPTVEQWSALYQ